MEALSEADKELLKGKTREYVHHNAETLKRLGLKVEPTITFPGRKRVPLLGRLGIWLVNLVGGMMDVKFAPRDGA